MRNNNYLTYSNTIVKKVPKLVDHTEYLIRIIKD